MKLTQLEVTNEKISIRRHLLAQAFEFFKLHDNFSINSLPAASWKWEDNLINHLNMVHPNKTATMHCFDRDEKLKEFFPYSNQAHNIKGVEVLRGQNGNVDVWGFFGLNFAYSFHKKTATLSWADYCGTPNETILNDFSAAICDGDIIYVTFSNNWRRTESIPKNILRLRNLMSEQEATLMVLEKLIRSKLGSNFTRIYYCDYIGGKRTPMITVGWHFVANSPILPLRYEWANKNKIVKPTHVEPVKALLRDGVSDEEILKQWPELTRMKLAGCKAAIKRETKK